MMLHDIAREAFPRAARATSHVFHRVLPYVRPHADLRVVLYHGIGDGTDPSFAHLDDEITADTFRAQLDYLETRYSVVSLDDAMRCLHAGDRPDRPLCVLTFDDGLRTVATAAAPILHARGFVASVFLNTSVIGTTDRLWQHHLSRLMHQYGVRTVARWLLDRTAWTCDLSTGPQVIEQCQTHFADVLPLLPELTAWPTTPPTPDRLYLDWTEIDALRQDGWTFYSHTARHYPLAALTAADRHRELVEARDTLAAHGMRSPFVSFPFGMLRDFGTAGRTDAHGLHDYLVEVEDGSNAPGRIRSTRSVRRVCLSHATTPADLHAALEIMPLVKGFASSRRATA